MLVLTRSVGQALIIGEKNNAIKVTIADIKTDQALVQIETGEKNTRFIMHVDDFATFGEGKDAIKIMITHIEVMDMGHVRVRIGTEAPKHIRIAREEIYGTPRRSKLGFEKAAGSAVTPVIESPAANGPA